MLKPVFTSPRAPGGSSTDGVQGMPAGTSGVMRDDRGDLGAWMERLADRLDQIEFTLGDSVEAAGEMGAESDARVARLEALAETLAGARGGHDMLARLERVAEANEAVAAQLGGLSEVMALSDSRLSLIESRLDSLAARIGATQGPEMLDRLGDRIADMLDGFGETMGQFRRDVAAEARAAIEEAGISAAEAEQTALLARLNRQVLAALGGIGSASERAEVIQQELKALLLQLSESHGTVPEAAPEPEPAETKALRRLAVLNGQIAARVDALGEGPEGPALVKSIRRAIDTILSDARPAVRRDDEAAEN